MLVSVILMGGCDSSPSEPDPDTLPELPMPRSVADSSYTVTSTGLQYFDFEVGDTRRAQADSGNVVLIHYHGWLPDGTLFESSIIAGQPFQFLLGTGQVISGWDEGIKGMYLGGQRQLVIPPSLGYGDTPRGSIPANSTLIFEVYMLGLGAP